MKASVQKWGNSLALRIPKAFADEVGLRENAQVDLSLVDGALVVQPVVSPPFTLDQLLAGITEGNRHDEIETGSPVGREAW